MKPHLVVFVLTNIIKNRIQTSLHTGFRQRPSDIMRGRVRVHFGNT